MILDCKDFKLIYNTKQKLKLEYLVSKKNSKIQLYLHGSIAHNLTLYNQQNF